jgi:hypothetical protein
MRMTTIMLMLLIVIVIVIASMKGNSHLFCTCTFALFDMRSSTVDVCPPQAAL